MSSIACVLCKWLRRLIGRDDPTWLEAADQLRSEILFGDWNADALFEADADPARLRDLATLWDENPREAFPHFLALAEAGSVWSMIRVGFGYSLGLGVARDPGRAERWFTAAFEGGSDHGLIWGARAARKRGDLAKAKRLLEVGVLRGPLQATVDLAGLILDIGKSREERDRARSLYEAAMDKGYLPAQGEFALSMAAGGFGWRAIPEGIRRLREHVKASDGLIDARKRQLLAGVEVRQPQTTNLSRGTPGAMRAGAPSET